jgi:hypothetical protein
MYYIPKGKPMHEKLSTTFVRMEGLLEELKAENFSGYVYLNFPQTSGYLFIQDGSVINAAEISGQDQRAGMAIQEQLLRLSQQTKGTLSVYYLQKEIVQTLAGIADGEAVYNNLTSDWANLAKLIKKLASERRAYFINLVFEAVNQKRGLIFIEGDKVEAACATGEDHLLGPEALNRLTKDSETEVAIFSVYRQATAAALPSLDDKEVEASLTRFISQAGPSSAPVTTSPALSTAPVTPPSPPPAQPPVQTTPATASTVSTAPPSPPVPYYESLLPSGGRPESAAPETQAEVKPKAGGFEDILEVVEVEAPGRPGVSPSSQVTSPITSVSAAQVTPAPLPETPKSGNEMRDLMQLMSQVVAAVERGMTVAGRGSSFPTALRAGLLAVTERYPFLDPFAAEFEYQDKEIVFVGTAQPVEFASGLSEALRQMVEDLIYSSNGRVRDYIAEELRKVERERANDIRRFNLGNLTEKICQH